MQKSTRHINPDLNTSSKDLAKESDSLRYSNCSDEEIWTELKNGNDSAIAFIYRNYANPLFKYGYQIIQNDELIKDCIQDLFFDLITKREKLGNVRTIKYYLFASFRRKLFSKVKKERKFVDRLHLQKSESGFDIICSPESKMISEQLSNEQCKLIDRACLKLTKRQREAVILYFYECFSYKQIAEIMHKGKVKSTRVLIYRAIKALQVSLLKSKEQLFFYMIVFFI